MPERAVTTCTNHCGQCHRHFHSLAGFDAHHRLDETGWPRCLDPLDLVDLTGNERLEALTEHGECRMYAETQYDVTIWTIAGARERFTHWHEKGPESPAAAA